MNAPDAVIAARVAEVLSAAEYGSIVDGNDARERGLWLGPSAEPEPLATLTRLFTLGVSSSTDAVNTAIAPMSLDEWVQGGLIETEGDRVRPLVRFLPHGGVLLACDETSRADLDAEQMVGAPNAEAAALANLTLRSSIGEALVIDGGPGLHGLLAARHSEWTVVVDDGPRTGEFAAFNAELNGINNVGTMRGSLFEPVEGRTFDLIVCDRTFTISPGASDAGLDLPADAPVVRLLRMGADRLNEGGFFQMLCTWTQDRGQEWPAKLASWIENLDCDAFVLVEDIVDPALYAARALREDPSISAEGFSEAFDGWMRFYDERAIEGIGVGFLALRKRSAPDNWMFVDTEIESLMHVASDRVLRAFQTRDNLRELADDRVLLGTHLQLAEDVRLHQVAEAGDNAWKGIALEIRNEGGATGQIDPAMAQLLGGCDGSRTAAELLTELAEGVEISRDEAFAQGVPILRNLIAAGFLRPS